MVINSTKINKTKLHLSPQLTQHKKTTTYYLELGQPKICGGVKPVNEIPTFPLDKCFFLTRAIHNKQMINKTLDILVST